MQTLSPQELPMITAEIFKSQALPCASDMWRVAVRMLHDADDAADVVQEAFANVWEHRGKHVDHIRIRSYLLTAVRNLCLDRLRRNRECRISDSVADTMLAPDDVHAGIEGRQHLQMLDEMMQTLSPDCARVIRLNAYNGLSAPEIADITGFSYDKVRALLSRGRRRLREMFYAYTDQI